MAFQEPFAFLSLGRVAERFGVERAAGLEAGVG